jgi:hypothetical protein
MSNGDEHRLVHTIAPFAHVVDLLERKLGSSRQARQKLIEILEAWEILAQAEQMPHAEVRLMGRPRDGILSCELKHKSLTLYYRASGKEVVITHGHL